MLEGYDGDYRGIYLNAELQGDVFDNMDCVIICNDIVHDFNKCNPYFRHVDYVC